MRLAEFPWVGGGGGLGPQERALSPGGLGKNRAVTGSNRKALNPGEARWTICQVRTH